MNGIDLGNTHQYTSHDFVRIYEFCPLPPETVLVFFEIWWHTPINPAPKEWKHEYQEFKVTSSYIGTWELKSGLRENIIEEKRKD